jgi:hypothetical protein
MSALSSALVRETIRNNILLRYPTKRVIDITESKLSFQEAAKLKSLEEKDVILISFRNKKNESLLAQVDQVQIKSHHQKTNRWEFIMFHNKVEFFAIPLCDLSSMDELEKRIYLVLRDNDDECPICQVNFIKEGVDCRSNIHCRVCLRQLCHECTLKIVVGDTFRCPYDRTITVI